jgi:hypothetical protein
LYDFDSADTPLKIPLHTHQADVFMNLENNSSPELRNIAEAVKVLQEKGAHPFILENLENKHFRQIAVRHGKNIQDDVLESDEELED